MSNLTVKWQSADTTSRRIPPPQRIVVFDSGCCLLLATWEQSVGTASVWSVEATSAQVVGDDDVGDGIEDKLNVVSVSGASLVAVDLLRCTLVLCLKLCLDVRGCFLVALFAYTSSSASLSTSVSQLLPPTPKVIESYVFASVGRYIGMFVNNFLAPIQVRLSLNFISHPWPQGTRWLNFGRSRSKAKVGKGGMHATKRPSSYKLSQQSTALFRSHSLSGKKIMR